MMKTLLRLQLILISISLLSCNENEINTPVSPTAKINQFFEIGKTYQLDTITVENTETNEKGSSFFSDPHVSASLTILNTAHLLYTYEMKANPGHEAQSVEKMINYRLDNLTLWTEEPLFRETLTYDDMIGDFYKGQTLDYHVATMYPGDTSLYRLDVNYGIKLTFKRGIVQE